MEKIKEIKFDLEGLTCADCAGKIQDELGKRTDVKQARVDVVLGKAILEMNEETDITEDFLADITSTVHKIDPIGVRLEGTKNHEHDHDHEHAPMSRFIYLGVILIGLRLLLGESIWLNALIVAAYFLVGFPVLKGAWNSIKNGNYFDETVLMSVATIGALFIREYSEALGVMVFYSIGEYYQHKAVDDSRASIKALLDKRPEFARRLRDGVEEVVACEEINVSDVIRILPSDQVPLDGVIIKGQTSLDMSSLTGESVPVNVDLGQEVLSGSLNVAAPIELEVTASYSNSTITKMLDLIENSSQNKAETEIFMTKFSKVYTPIVFALSLIIMIVVGFLSQDLYSGLYRGLVFLVISCPCALVLSIPLGYFAGIGRASRSGILIKGGESIEAMSAITGVVFDKTGTLTQGKMQVTEVVGDDKILEIAAHLESFSNHPIGKAIVDHYDGVIEQSKVTNLNEVFGKGITAQYEGKDVFVGSLKELEAQGYDVDVYKNNKTSVVVLCDSQVLGALYLEDELRDDSIALIKALHDRNIKTVVLSGDRQEVVDETAQKAGIDLALGGLLPDDKVNEFTRLKNEMTGSLAYVGDGMNDAAVLGMSDVGFSMGQIGNDLAIEYSDVVLVNDQPLQIIEAIDISKRTQKITWMNIIFILLIKVSVLLLGSLGMAKMWQAVIADVGVSLLAVLNAMRIMRD
ncbi:heavy metal translocating P-type ATPase [Erysipelothrix urinaevulpis]|uniref:heavy metal translocating P-type ATPase n=1 Tax=Erysipelothrix urinaevulpis TaxID=2683717 RepID=UPI00135C4BE0|nr:heavy metal translocating P-type ATPase [Erysipelothrix urinaevulpis]